MSAKIGSCGNAAAVVIEGADKALTDIESASQALRKGKGRGVKVAAFMVDASPGSAEPDITVLPDEEPV